MYLNGCLSYPSMIPLDMALNYWTSYSAYHEAAYAALLGAKSEPIRHDLRHSFHHLNSARSDKDHEYHHPKDKDHRNYREESGQPKSSPSSTISNDPRLSPLGKLKRLSPENADCHKGYNGVLDFSKKSSTQQSPSSELKFGINRILSDKVGSKDNDNGKAKDNLEAENHYVPTSCPCSSSSCPYASCRRVPGLTSSLSAVHALRPPQYPVTSGTDALPGPYSVLNTDSSCPSHPKRKRSWSRAVFSQLQRKGLEKRFEVQKYVTKPDRRQLAAMLGLTDAQVKVWFQNRRMKWRHAEKSAQQTSAAKDNPEKREQDSCNETDTPHQEELLSKSDISSPASDVLSSDDEEDSVEQMDSSVNDGQSQSLEEHPSQTTDIKTELVQGPA